MKRGLLVLFILLLTITAVSGLELRHEVVQGEALPGGQVSYILNLVNNEQIPLTIILKSVDLNWVLDQEGQRFTLSPDESRDVTVSFTPLAEDRIKPGNYGVAVFIDTQSTRLERLLPAKVLRYDEVLTAEFTPEAKIDPRRGAILRLTVSNTKKINLQNLNLDLTSDHFQYTRELSIDKEGSSLLELPVTLDPETVRGNYFAHILISLNSKTLLDTTLAYSIEEYENLKEVSTPKKGFLVGGENIVLTNDGNTPSAQTVSRQFSWLAYKFTSSGQEPTRVTKNNKGFLVEWDVNLDPQAQAGISYETNYRTLAAIILLIIIALALQYVFRKRNAIVVTKRVLAMHNEAGNVRVMKLVLNIRNRGNLSVNNVRIVDRVPSVVKAPTQYGALRPNHIKATPQGTTMVWDFSNIRPREEKIVSYRLEGHIQVLGKLVLPPAIGKYIFLGRAITATSSSVSLREKK